jgi:hypothetical protein
VKRESLLRHLRLHGCYSNAKAALTRYGVIQKQDKWKLFRATQRWRICWRERFAADYRSLKSENKRKNLKASRPRRLWIRNLRRIWRRISLQIRRLDSRRALGLRLRRGRSRIGQRLLMMRGKEAHTFLVMFSKNMQPEKIR